MSSWPRLHHIDDDLMPNALDDWAAEGIKRLERLLLAHARFADYLAERGQA